MNDLISRQAVLDAFEGELYSLSLFEKIQNLPSAQPETHEERTETHSCDCISRQAAINALTSHIMPHNNEDGTVTIGVLSKSSIKNILNKLPSAQPDLPEWAQKVDEYRKSAPSFVRNKLVWALYQTWKEYDGRLVHQRGKENR